MTLRSILLRGGKPHFTNHLRTPTMSRDRDHGHGAANPGGPWKQTCSGRPHRCCGRGKLPLHAAAQMRLRIGRTPDIFCPAGTHSRDKPVRGPRIPAISLEAAMVLGNSDGEGSSRIATYLQVSTLQMRRNTGLRYFLGCKAFYPCDSGLLLANSRRQRRLLIFAAARSARRQIYIGPSQELSAVRPP